MKADLTRSTFIPERHYSRTIQQQGRVPLDADANEQIDIDRHRDALETVDVIGKNGVPKGDSFTVVATPDGKDLRLLPGHIYVDGTLCQLEGDGVAVGSIPAATTVVVPKLIVDGLTVAKNQWVEIWSNKSDGQLFRVASVDTASGTITLAAGSDAKTPFGGKQARLRIAPTYTAQPDWPTPDGTTGTPPVLAPAKGAGQYLAYLDVWERHVTALEDPHLRETALGGPDTCTRSKTVWQLKLAYAGTLADKVDCSTGLPQDSGHGRLTARAKRTATDAPCSVKPTAQYRSLENQLYRVEIHDGDNNFVAGSPTTATFKFSRDNGSIVAAWTNASAVSGGTELTVNEPGKDSATGFTAGQWVELLDDARELGGKPGTLTQITKVVGQTLTVSNTTIKFADYQGGNPRVRRWDEVSATGLLAVDRPATNNGFLALELGVEVKFADGRYDTGDYWLIPARAALGDIDWPRDADGTTPLAVERNGIEHHYAPLGIVTFDGTKATGVSDCRKQFPPLNHICADDVCLHDDPCGMGATTVQEAIEKLCAEKDLKFHNHNLHGWGVVNGMQINCMTTGFATQLNILPKWGEYVWLRQGYSIDPYGYDIIIDTDQTAANAIWIADLIEKAGIATRDPKTKLLNDCSVTLWIDKDKKLHVDSYDPNAKPSVLEMLDGTLIGDFYTDCLKPLVDFITGEFGPQSSSSSSSSSSGGATAPVDLVPINIKRLEAFLLNLVLAQFQPDYGGFVYLSGETPFSTEDPNKEDYILRTIFLALQMLLQSDTFCGMFADLKYPDYDVYVPNVDKLPHPTTIFNNFVLHTRLRLHPDGKYAFTMGSNDTINVFDLTTERLIHSVQFPVTGAIVQDVAFDPTGNIIYCIAWIGGGGGNAPTDSMFVAGTLSADRNITWNVGNQVKCSKKLMQLATSSRAALANRVYASSQGDGVYVFDPVAFGQPSLLNGFTFGCTGQIAISDRQINGLDATFLYAGNDTKNTSYVAYDSLLKFDIDAGGTHTSFNLTILSTNDLVVADSANNSYHYVYAVSEPAGGANIGLARVNVDDPKAGVTWEAFDDSKSQHGHAAFNPKTNLVFTALEDTYRGVCTNAVTTAMSQSIHPLQLGPVSAACDSQGTYWYVLNYLSNTITKIPAKFTADQAKVAGVTNDQSLIDLNKLAQYRADALTAFVKMIGRFLQYLKDCFCDHITLKIPDPTGKKVVLADVSFKGGAVWQICNFSRRHYVKTWDGVLYWTSIIPILPWLKKWVADFCCAELPGIFDKFVAPKSTFLNGVKVSQGRMAVNWAQSLNVRTMVGAQATKLLNLGSSSTRMLSATLQRAPGVSTTSPSVNVSSGDLLNQSASSASNTAASKGVLIGNVTQVSGAQSAGLLARAVVSPTTFARGTKIDLFTDSTGKVVAFAPSTADAAGVSELRQQVADQQAQITGAQQAASQVTTLSATVNDLQVQLKQRDDSIDQLKTTLASVQAQTDARSRDLSALSAQLSDLSAQHQALQNNLLALSARLGPAPGGAPPSGSAPSGTSPPGTPGGLTTPLTPGQPRQVTPVNVPSTEVTPIKGAPTPTPTPIPPKKT